ncbi:MAG TPA: hypothetical protein VGA44_07080 [Steroidobacteraceae bacterium]
MARRTFLGNLRLALLMGVLIFVALGALLDRSRSRDWDAPLRVTVYLLAAADDDDVHSYLAGMDDATFDAAEAFVAEQAVRYGVALEEPMRLRISRAATALPPELGADPGPLGVVLWSLRMRYWAWRVAANDPLPPPDIQLFALYYPFVSDHALPDSLGLSKGLIAVARLFAGYDAEDANQVVVVHELLHTLGATDKYDRRNGRLNVPDGLGDPLQEPRFPQSQGEIMAGRIAVSPLRAELPDRLAQMVVGAATAREIGWTD